MLVLMEELDLNVCLISPLQHLDKDDVSFLGDGGLLDSQIIRYGGAEVANRN